MLSQPMFGINLTSILSDSYLMTEAAIQTQNSTCPIDPTLKQRQWMS